MAKSFKDEISKLKEEGNFRELPKNLPSEFIDFSSNDYLGISLNNELFAEFMEKRCKPVFSSCASRLLASCQEPYFNLESFLEDLYHRPALIYNSGYHANTGILPVISSGEKTLIIADKLVHASIIDGIKLSGSDYRRFPHNNMNALRKILEKNYDNYSKIIIVAESIYSMDGDLAPIEELLSIKKEYEKVILYLDEAHSFGLRGPKGLGMAMASSFPDAWDIIVNPLGKAAASMGAFVICDEETKQILINKSRPLIFSTALPPMQVEWSRYVIEKILAMDKEREHLTFLSQKLAECIANHFGNSANAPSHIQPLIIGDSQKTILISQLLYEEGIKALPIRKPTVAAGTERLRFSLSAKMNMTEIDKLDYTFSKINAAEFINR